MPESRRWLAETDCLGMALARTTCRRAQIGGARANGVGLCFIRGATLPDPEKVLLGSGNQAQFVRLDSPQVLERPDVKALVAAAIAQARVPFQLQAEGN
jgi:hypothetical protein